MNEKMFNIGKIVNTHGIDGEVKVLRISDFDERFAIGQKLYVVNEREHSMELLIDGHRIHKGFDLVHFKNLNNINDVEHFKGAYLQISESQLTDLDANEYYYHEIIGCDVYTCAEEKLGVVKEVLSPGANDVWVIKQSEGKDVLIPYIEDVVKSVDINEKKIVIEPMEGLLD